MRIQYQVPTFEQSKLLYEAGVKRNRKNIIPCMLAWCEAAEYDKDIATVIKWHPCLFMLHTDMQYECVYCPVPEELLIIEDTGDFRQTRGEWPAYTVAELGIMLPVSNPSWRFNSPTTGEGEKWIATTIIRNSQPGSEVNITTEPLMDQYGDNEAQVRANLLLYLLKYDLATPEEINERLNFEK